MPLVPAKCPECGGNINIDSEKRAAICEFCKQPFVVEDAINNFNTTYNITNNNEIIADVVTLNIDNEETLLKRRIEEIKTKFEIIKKRKTEKITHNSYDNLENWLKSLRNENPTSIEVFEFAFYLIIDIIQYELNDNGANLSYTPARLELLEVYETLCILNPESENKYKEELNLFYSYIREYTLNYQYDKQKEIFSLKDTYGIMQQLNYDHSHHKELEMALIYGFVNGYCASPFKEEIVAIKELIDEYFPKGERTTRLLSVYGHFATFSITDFEGDYTIYLVQINESITHYEQLKQYLEEYKKVTEQKHKEQQQQWISYCQSKKICPLCRGPLSLLNKCKNASCSNYGDNPFK